MPKKPKTNHLKKLLKTWAAAAPEERRAFLDLVAAKSRAAGEDSADELSQASEPETAQSQPYGHVQQAETLIANGRYLLPSTIARVERVMRVRRISPSAIMGELGFSPRDPSLARGLAMKASVRLAVIEALRSWLIENEAVAGERVGEAGEGES